MEELHKISDEKYRACFNIDSSVGCYYLTFAFSKVVVEWDEYYGEAWYEDSKWKKEDT